MEKLIAQSVKDLYGLEVEVNLTRPDIQFGDYATNVAMQLAKPVGKSPREIAEELVAKLLESGQFEEVSVAGPGFINLRVSAVSMASSLSEQWSDKYGENSDGAGRSVLVEFPSPNVAKPYSVGHLRPGNQGWAAKRLMEVTGWEVITDNHIGDYGSPFGVWVAGFLRFSNEKALKKSGVYELGRVYIVTKKALKDEEAKGQHELADEVQDWLLKLESGDKQAVKYSELFNKISLDHIHGVMERLRISTDYELGEAFYVAKGKQAVKTLIDEAIAEKNSDGSVIVPLDEYGFDVPLLIQKSNGAALYATTDLGTLLYRDKEWDLDRVIYAVGAEQQFYFSQLFALAKKLGIKTEFIHLWFGTIDQIDEDGTRAKMSSRKGVVLMEELLDKAEARARLVTESREVSEVDIKKIALGAVKFSDFIADRRTNILFDWDNIFALSGFSGPYVQYAAVRVNKILKNYQGISLENSEYDYSSEKQVIAKLLEYPGVVKISARDLEPHKIASYLYELAREMNKYYETTRVAGSSEAERAPRIETLRKVAQVFSHGLSILGIEVPESM